MRNRRAGLAGLLLAVAVAFGLVPAAVSADFAASDWRYVKTLSVPPGLQPGSLVQVLPDTEMFAGASAGLADVRIIAGQDAEVPYKLDVSRGERQRTALPVTMRDRGYVPGSHTVFTADLGREGSLHNAIEFQTSSTNFRRRATVESSRDGDAWMRVAEQTVFDFTVKERDFNTRNTRVMYADSTGRYLRVTIADDGEGPLDVTSASVFLLRETPPLEISWPASLLGTVRDPQRRATLVEVDLATPGVPSYRVELSVPDINFDRPISLEASADRKDWKPVLSRARIYAYDTPRFVGRSLSFTYPETTFRYLRMVIHDGDSPPLTVRGVSVWGAQRRLVFAVTSPGPYRLYYGNPETRSPSYDIERVFPYLATEQLPEAKPGPQAANPSFVQKQPPVSERFPWLLPVAVAAAAVLIGLVLVGIIRQARKVLPPPPR